MTKPEPLQTFKHDESVKGVQFSRDESSVETVSWYATRIWDITDPLAMLTLSERILELEVRSGATLDEQLNLRTLKFDEWQAKVQSVKYRAIAKKLAARTAKPDQAMNRRPTVETPGSPSKP